MSFYKGILPPILAETPKRATKFFTFEQYKSVFASIDGLPMAYVSSHFMNYWWPTTGINNYKY